MPPLLCRACKSGSVKSKVLFEKEREERGRGRNQSWQIKLQREKLCEKARTEYKELT